LHHAKALHANRVNIPRALLAAFHKTGFFEHPKMPRHGWAAHREPVGEPPHGLRRLAKREQNVTPQWTTKSIERVR
jgi:hypothetical protein